MSNGKYKRKYLKGYIKDFKVECTKLTNLYHGTREILLKMNKMLSDKQFDCLMNWYPRLNQNKDEN